MDGNELLVQEKRSKAESETRIIRLAEDTIGKEDIDELIGWLSGYPRLTKGELTEEFEEQFAAHLGAKYAVFVNSGSSANLLVAAALKDSLWQQRSKIHGSLRISKLSARLFHG